MATLDLTGKDSPDSECRSCGLPRNRDSYGAIIDSPYTGCLDFLCQACRIRHISHIWKDAKSWKQILQFNLIYIRQEIDCNPRCATPLYDETLPIVPNLIRLHEYGIMTTSSQPDWVDEDGQVRIAEYGRKVWYQGRQKAYLNFLIPTLQEQIPKAKVKMFVDALLTRNDVLTTIYSEFDEYPEEAKRAQWRAREVAPLPRTSTDSHDADALYYFRSTAPPRPYWVTEYRMGPTQEALQAAKWEQQTRSGATTIRDLDKVQYRQPGNKFRAIEAMRPLIVQVVAKEYGENVDIQKLVEDVCIQIGLEKVFEGINDEDAEEEQKEEVE